MSLQKLHDVVMVEENLGLIVELVFALVEHHHRDEVHELHRGLLLCIYLRVLDCDEFVTDVLLDLQGNLDLKHVLDHSIVVCLYQLENVLSRDEEVRIV